MIVGSNRIMKKINGGMIVLDDGTIANKDTGEIISKDYNVIVESKNSHKRMEYIKSKLELGNHEIDNGGFVLLFYEVLTNMSEYLPNLTRPDLARLLYLTTYVGYESNVIKHNNGKIIKEKDMMAILKFKDKRSYNTFINKLVDNNYLYTLDDGTYKISFNICIYGKRDIAYKEVGKNMNYIRLFRKAIRELFENSTARELSKVSLIYQMLPYVATRFNILCSNPLESDSSKLNPLSVLELSVILGYSNVQKFRKTIQELRVGNIKLISLISNDIDARKSKIAIHPSVIFGGNHIELEFLNVIFKDKFKIECP